MQQPFLTVTVARRIAEAADVVALELSDPTGTLLPPFSAGSHIDVLTAPGLVRQYSLCNNPVERHRYLIGVLNEPGGRGGSAALHAIAEGAELRISEPRNHFSLDASATRSLLFAGGIGVTPILCMAERLAATGSEFFMHYAARSQDRMAFRDRIAQSTFANRVALHFDDGPPEQLLDIAGALGQPEPQTHVYVCGPPGFIDIVLSAARAAGFPESKLHREYFAADPSASPAVSEAFRVQIASTGQVLDVPAGQTVLDIMRAHGIEPPASCEQGVCGTCVTRILQGVPDHRDCYFTEDERARGDQFTPCCSRSKSALLILDL